MSDKAEIVQGLLEEISIITRHPVKELDAAQGLAANGINSMGFIELLLGASRKWGVNLVEKGVTAADVQSINALADRIMQEQGK